MALEAGPKGEGQTASRAHTETSGLTPEPWESLLPRSLDRTQRAPSQRLPCAQTRAHRTPRCVRERPPTRSLRAPPHTDSASRSGGLNRRPGAPARNRAFPSPGCPSIWTTRGGREGNRRSVQRRWVRHFLSLGRGVTRSPPDHLLFHTCCPWGPGPAPLCPHAGSWLSPWAVPAAPTSDRDASRPSHFPAPLPSAWDALCSGLRLGQARRAEGRVPTTQSREKHVSTVAGPSPGRDSSSGCSGKPHGERLGGAHPTPQGRKRPQHTALQLRRAGGSQPESEQRRQRVWRRHLQAKSSF